MSVNENEPYRVMVVDDSLVIRGIINRMVQSDPMIKVVKSVSNGEMAVNEVKADKNIEIVILDIEMPVKDGITALPEIVQANRNVQVIMSSTLTEHNAEISMRALSLGACDYVTKPTSTTTLNSDKAYQTELIEKIKTFGARARKNRLAATAEAPKVLKPKKEGPSNIDKLSDIKHEKLVGNDQSSGEGRSLYDGEFKTVKPNFKILPEILAIGSSTGGPPALFKIFEQIGTSIRQPILLTQHMPATFTKILAEHIAKISGKEAMEGQDGMLIEPGKVYVAPGGYHMVVEKKEGNHKILRINSDPPENFCRPAVDPMFRSVAKAYGPKALALVLTGMGCDGAKGAKVIYDAGGNVVAQDEATSVVWGMPGATAHMGVCCSVLPLNDIVAYLKSVM